MADIIYYDKPIDFMKSNHEFIYNDLLAHYHLIHVIEQLKAQTLRLYDCFNITDEHQNWILGLRVDHGYYLYASSWTSEMVNVLVRHIKLNNFKNISVCGQRELVKELFAASNEEGEVFKNRFMEHCIQVKPAIKILDGHGQNGSLRDYDELLQLCIDYYQEEFKGKGSQSKEDIGRTLHRSIENQSTFCWKNSEKQIVSIVQHINTGAEDVDFAMIGGFYTDPKYRGKGYGYSLMHSITKGLLNAGYDRCGLVSDADNVITSKIFDQVGYVQIYNWVLMNKFSIPNG